MKYIEYLSCDTVNNLQKYIIKNQIGLLFRDLNNQS